jgi:Zn-dependent M28 family amino/carboxypeptidase
MRLKTLLVGGIAAFAFATPAAAQYADEAHDHGAQAQPGQPAPPAEPPTPVSPQIDDLEWQTELGFEPEMFRSHILFLADDMLEGREAGTRGYDLAARYVASQFAGLGLTPGNDGSWYQEVRFGRSTAAEGARLTVGNQSFASGEGFIFTPGVQSQPLNVEAPLVFVGYGIDAPTQGHDDYRGLDVRGKVVVMLAGLPEGLRSDVSAHLGSGRAQMAAARGAIGAIVLRPEAAAAQAPMSRLAGFAGRPATTWVNEAGAPGAPHQQLRFTAIGDAPLAQTLFAGSRRSWAQVAADVAAKRRPAGFALRPRVRAERTAETTNFTSPNVVAIIPGSDPALATEYVVLMGHLDHIGVLPAAEGADPSVDRINNGAMDNATGIATLIEVARKFSDPANRPRRPILLVASTAEEKGLLGASFLANNPIVDGRIVGVVNLDMPILTYDFEDVVAFGAEHSEMGPMVERAARSMNVALSEDPLPEQGLFTRSDHYPFVQAGIPSVFLMTGFRNGGEAKFKGFLGGNYHSPRDQLTQPFSWRAGARFAELNFRIARELANTPTAPRWYRGSFFGDTLGGDQQLAPRPAAATGAGAN